MYELFREHETFDFITENVIYQPFTEIISHISIVTEEFGSQG